MADVIAAVCFGILALHVLTLWYVRAVWKAITKLGAAKFMICTRCLAIQHGEQVMRDYHDRCAAKSRGAGAG